MNGNMNQGMNNYNNNDSMMDLNMVNQGIPNQNANEQDLILKNKIEKREKMDTIIAYVLLAILAICIIALLCLKFTRKEEPIEDNLPKTITLNEIATLLNSSRLYTDLTKDGASFDSNVSGSSLVVTYTKGKDIINLNMPLIGTELELAIPENNTDIVTDIYKEVATIICAYYGNDEASCRSTLESVNSEETVEGIRYNTIDNINYVYIETIRSIILEVVYNEVTQIGINVTDYKLNLSNYKIKNINIEKSPSNIKFSGRVEKNQEETNNFSVIVKLYDLSNNLLGENKYEFNEENSIDKNNTFSVDFILNDEIKLDNITSYSIEIAKGE